MERLVATLVLERDRHLIVGLLVILLLLHVHLHRQPVGTAVEIELVALDLKGGLAHRERGYPLPAVDTMQELQPVVTVA